MANEAEAYAIEKHFLAALKAVLTLSGVQTLVFGDPATHETPRIEVSFDVTGVDQLARSHTSAGEPYMRRYSADITVAIFGEDKAAHLALVGKVRAKLAYNQPALEPPTLIDYYQVHSLYETDGESGLSSTEEDFELMTTLNYTATFAIVPSAFDPQP